MKYKLVMGPDSAFPGQDVHPRYNSNGNNEVGDYAATTNTKSEL